MRDRDTQQKFLIESCDVRGHLVQLDDTWQDAVARIDYPPAVRQVLGEAFVAATLLASTIKFDGKLTLQVRGEGSVYLLVVQITNDGSLRGLARWKGDTVDDNLQALFGDDARMIITIEANRTAEPYQGIVPLEGETLANAFESYFRTSEQLSTRLFLAVSEKTVAGVLIQKLPTSERLAHDADGWERANVLCETLSDEELCVEESQTLLHRLFHQERVRIFEPGPVRFHCSCSRERTDGMLTGLGKPEVTSILEEQGKVEISCEFCDSVYTYDKVDVAALFKGISTATVPSGMGEDGNEVTQH